MKRFGLLAKRANNVHQSIGYVGASLLAIMVKLATLILAVPKLALSSTKFVFASKLAPTKEKIGVLMGLCFVVLSFTTMPTLAAQEIKPFVSGSIQQIVSARQGKPFVIFFWSLSCSYCKADLDMFKKLSTKYPMLDLVLISTDTPEEEKTVSATLSKFALGKAESWVFADSYTERLYFEIDRQWHGELPRTYFFSAKNEIKSISGKLDQKEVEQWAKTQYGH